MPNLVSPDITDILELVSRDEIKSIVKLLSEQKAPDPDGITDLVLNSY
jgi:hypothetical protein